MARRECFPSPQVQYRRVSTIYLTALYVSVIRPSSSTHIFLGFTLLTTDPWKENNCQNYSKISGTNVSIYFQFWKKILQCVFFSKLQNSEHIKAIFICSEFWSLKKSEHIKAIFICSEFWSLKKSEHMKGIFICSEFSDFKIQNIWKLSSLNDLQTLLGENWEKV
jgi:hypothetical protein